MFCWQTSGKSDHRPEKADTRVNLVDSHYPVHAAVCQNPP